MDRNKELKVHRLRLPGRSLCSIRSNRKWCKRRGSSLQCQNCFFVYPIIDCNLKNLLLKSYHILKHISIPIVSAPIYCIAFRRKCVSFCFFIHHFFHNHLFPFFPVPDRERFASVPSAKFPFRLFFKNPMNRIL